MARRAYRLEDGLTVHIASLSTDELIADRKLKTARKAGVNGVIVKAYPYADSWIYQVRHEDQTEAVYQEVEMQRASSYWVVSWAEAGAAKFQEVASYNEAKELCQSKLAEGSESTIRGPMYEAKQTLESGTLATKGLFDYLTSDDD